MFSAMKKVRNAQHDHPGATEKLAQIPWSGDRAPADSQDPFALRSLPWEQPVRQPGPPEAPRGALGEPGPFLGEGPTDAECHDGLLLESGVCM